MSQYVEGPVSTFTSAGAITQFARVVVGSGGTITVAGAADFAVGTAEVAAASGTPVPVRLRTAEGTQKCVAAAAITRGNLVYAAASGKVTSVANPYVYGLALESATADGDVIEVQPLHAAPANTVTLASASGAISIVPGTVVITKTGSLAAMTLAAPTAAQNGTIINITSSTAFAHTVTATGLFDDGVTGGSKNTATFAAFAGASMTVMAYEGKWHTLSLKAVTVA